MPVKKAKKTVSSTRSSQSSRTSGGDKQFFKSPAGIAILITLGVVLVALMTTKAKDEDKNAAEKGSMMNNVQMKRGEGVQMNKMMNDENKADDENTESDKNDNETDEPTPSSAPQY